MGLTDWLNEKSKSSGLSDNLGKADRALTGRERKATGAPDGSFRDKFGNFFEGRGWVATSVRHLRWAQEEKDRQEAMKLLRATPDATDAAVQAAASAERRKAQTGFGRRAAFMRLAAGMPTAPLGAGTLLGGK